MGLNKSLFLGCICILLSSNSHGIVGYVNVPVCAGFNLLNNPLDQGGNHISVVLSGSNLDGACVYRFDPATQTYKDAATWFSGLGWYEKPGESTILAPGEGFWFESPTNATITFVGEVMAGTLVNALPGNYSLEGSMVPIAAQLSATPYLNFPAAEGDTVWTFDCGSQSNPSSFFCSTPPFWDPSSLGPTIGVGRGFILHRTPASAGNWTITFSPAPSPSTGPQPAAAQISVKSGLVNLLLKQVDVTGCDVQFSRDRVNWTTVAVKVTGTTWRTAYPGGSQGFYRAVKP